MTSAIKILIGILVLAVILIAGWWVWKSYFKISEQPEQSKEEKGAQISIPEILRETIRDLIPLEYTLGRYYFKDSENKYKFYFVATKEKNLAPTLRLYKNLKLEDFENYSIQEGNFIEKNKIKEKTFRVKKVQFIKYRSFIEDRAGEFSQCAFMMDNDLLVLSGFNYMWGGFADCEDLIRNNFKDGKLYPNELNFKEAQKIYSRLSNNFQDCNWSFVTLSSKDPINPPYILGEKVDIEYTCNDQDIFISIQENTKSLLKKDCCLKTSFFDEPPKDTGSLDKVGNYEICTRYERVSPWLGKKFEYASNLNTQNYSVELLSHSKLPLIEKLVNSINSPDVGYVPVGVCKLPRGI